MQMPAQRIGVFGLFGAGNLGNDGSLEAMLRFLRTARPDAELTCICADPVKIEHTHAVRSIRIGGYGASGGWALGQLRPLRKLLQVIYAFRIVRKLDVMLVPGTGILDDFGDTSSGMPIALLTWCLAARLSGTRVAFVSVGAGPIVQPVSRRFMKAAARLAHYRSYRDTVSKAYMDSIGFDTSADPIAPDIAFSLPAPAGDGPRPASGDPVAVGVGVMAYYGWRGEKAEGAQAIYEAYLGRLARFVVRLLDRGHPVRIITGEHSDWQAVNDLMSRIASKRPDLPRERIVAEPIGSLHDLMRQIAETQVVVATRFHNIVCALRMGRPCISLGYAKKNDVLMADMGLGDFCQHIELLDVDVLTGQFARLVKDRAAYERSIRAKGSEYARRLAEQEQVLLERVLGGSRASGAGLREIGMRAGIEGVEG
jgi:polysaccharide pyruvyl transferase WcaK-like protein